MVSVVQAGRGRGVVCRRHGDGWRARDTSNETGGFCCACRGTALAHMNAFTIKEAVDRPACIPYRCPPLLRECCHLFSRAEQLRCVGDEPSMSAADPGLGIAMVGPACSTAARNWPPRSSAHENFKPPAGPNARAPAHARRRRRHGWDPQRHYGLTGSAITRKFPVGRHTPFPT